MWVRFWDFMNNWWLAVFKNKQHLIILSDKNAISRRGVVDVWKSLNYYPINAEDFVYIAEQIWIEGLIDE